MTSARSAAHGRGILFSCDQVSAGLIVNESQHASETHRGPSLSLSGKTPLSKQLLDKRAALRKFGSSVRS